MSLPIDRLIQAAIVRGLDVAEPVLFTTDSPTRVRVNVIVSHEEPIQVAAPLDLLWLQPDGTALRRISRAQDAGEYEHTWQVADETNFWLPQIWDEPRPADQDFQELNRNIGNPHGLVAIDIGAIHESGGSMAGPLVPRVATVEVPYAPNEVVPRSFVEQLTSAAQSLAASVYQQLSSVRSSVIAVRNRVTILEETVEGLEAGSGTPNFKYDRAEPLLEWLIVHNLKSLDVIVEARTETGLLMIPDQQIVVDDDTVRLTFAEARMGRAIVLGIR